MGDRQRNSHDRMTGRDRGGIALCVSLAALIAACSAANAQGLAGAELRGAQRQDPRAITTDPRFLEPDNPFAPAQPAPGAGLILPEGEAQPGANGGRTARVAPSRASRPVRVETSGGARRPVRTPQRQVIGLPPAAPPALGLRPTTSTRIVTSAPDGLRDGPARRPARQAADPWEPLGLRLGSFIVSPSITQSGGYDTNPNRSPRAAKGSAVSRTEGELAVRSDWSTHSFSANLRAGYSYFPGQRDASRPDASGQSALRLNVSRDTDIDLETRLSLDTQRPGSANFNASTAERPLVLSYGAAAGVTQRFNRLSLNLRGAVDRSTYENARDTLGGLIRQDDRDVVQLGARARLGYEVAPGVNPFIEISTDQRVFDDRVDQNGFRRGSTGVGARVGSTFEMSRLLTGEASVGVQQRDYEDPRLRELRGVVGDAALIWSATPLTTVTLRGSTELGDTTLPGVSGSVNRRVSLEVAHALRRNWTVTGFANAGRNSFSGVGLTEDTVQLGLRSEYKLTRSVAVRASFTHERLTSTAPGSDYTANILLLGLRLQL